MCMVLIQNCSVQYTDVLFTNISTRFLVEIAPNAFKPLVFFNPALLFGFGEKMHTALAGS